MHRKPPTQLAMAYPYPTQAAAAAVVARLTADDSDWVYTVNRVTDSRYVISVHEIDGEEQYFLGYL